MTARVGPREAVKRAGVRFRHPLRLAWISGHTWRLAGPFTYHSDRLGLVRVPAGMQTDLVSLPGFARLVLRVDGPELPAAIVHDYLYSGLSAGAWPDVTRAAADAVFLEAMAHLGVPWPLRVLLYLAVRVGGRRAWRRT